MNYRSVAAAFCVVAAVVAAPAWAQDTPTQLKGGKVIAVDEAKALLAAKSAAFIDTRSVLNFGKGHIPSAVTASYKEVSDKTADFDGSVDKFDFSKLPQDTSAKVVFYSDGPSGWKSYKAAVLAVKQGYSGVHYLRGGFSEWVAKGQAVDR
jgi:rhodanese-related sulfurtransferase